MAKKFILTAGGSGGHVFPAEALAKVLTSKGHRVDFITTKKSKNFKASFKDSDEYHIFAAGYAGKNIFRKLVGLFLLGLGVLQSLVILLKIRPDAVVGFGGYGSFPACFAAIMLRIPLIINEQNAVLGSANRILAPKSKLIALSFPKTSLLPDNIKTAYTGLPVRPSILALHGRGYPEIKDEYRLLIFGGSQGATVLSKVVPEALVSLPEAFRKKLRIAQQCRAADMEMVSRTYSGSGIDVEVSTFFDNMPERLEKAYLVICRAGASTIGELSASGRPSIMVPIANSPGNHQFENAKSLESVGGCILCLEKDFDKDWLAFKIQELFNNPKLLSNAAANAKTWGKTDSPELLAKAVLEITGE